MDFLGLDWVDITIVVGVLIVMMGVGLRVSRRTRREADFFVGGRKLGAVLQFFLNFGMMADTNEASIIGTEVYRQGAAGMWIGFQALFATPFFWFTPVWFRRTRLITYADLFTDRFNSRSLTYCYAGIQIAVLTLTLALGNLISYKVASAMLVKPPAVYTPEEKAGVADFAEYRRLRDDSAKGVLAAGEGERLEVLRSRADRGELASYVSYVKPLQFYICYSTIVGSYLLVGGLTTVAILDGLQGCLILFISVVLLPFGLMRVGGQTGLHQLVPAHMLELVGGEGSDYTWYTILAIVLNCVVVVPSSGGPGNASGKNERAIRMGTLTAAFTKRLVMIGWMVAGLVAVAIFQRGLSDPDNAWGMLSSTLLPRGMIGLMIVGMFVGHMPNVGFSAITISALFTRNLYEPAVRGRGQGHYMVVAKVAVVGVLAAATLIATCFTGVISILTTTLTFSAFFGAVGYLIYFWRRLRAGAIWVSMVVWIVGIGILPWALPRFEGFRMKEELLLTVEGGKGNGAAVFFDRVARVRPAEAGSPREGIGRFNVENYVLYRMGVPVDRFGAAGVVAARWYFDSVFPFLMLMGLSLVWVRGDAEEREAQEARDDRFFAKLRTPVGKTAEEETRELELSYANPRRFDERKLFANSNWEFSKWTRGDWLGFGGCWLIVLAILGGLVGLLRFY